MFNLKKSYGCSNDSRSDGSIHSICGIRGKSMLAQPATAVVFVPDEDINPGRFTPDGCAPS